MSSSEELSSSCDGLMEGGLDQCYDISSSNVTTGGDISNTVTESMAGSHAEIVTPASGTICGDPVTSNILSQHGEFATASSVTMHGDTVTSSSVVTRGDESGGAGDCPGVLCGSGTSLADDMYQCSMCCEKLVEPRLLHCLHTFCTKCLVAAVSKQSDQQGAASAGGVKNIVCHTCKQVTRVDAQSAITDLPLNVVLINLLDLYDITQRSIVCTSCKAQEKAIARCSDCSNFLCPNCVTAHNYMRCFENHKVESFDAILKNKVSIHKPMYCQHHSSELLKFYCTTCQMTACSECLVLEHKPPTHVCERIVEGSGGDGGLTTDFVVRHVEELKCLIDEAKQRVACSSSSSAEAEERDNILAELQQHKEAARDLINETFHSYKAALDRRRDELLSELDSMHSSTELSVMERFHESERSVELIEDGCVFAERVLSHSNTVELLYLKRFITRQLARLLNNLPSNAASAMATSANFEFITDPYKFDASLRASFGYLVHDHQHGDRQDRETLSPDMERDRMLQSLDSTDGRMLLSSPPQLLPSHASLSSHTPQLLSSHASLSGHATTPSSFNGLAAAQLIDSFAGVRLSDPALSADVSRAGLAAMSDMALAVDVSRAAGIAALVERSMSRNSYSPSMSDSGISVDTSSALSASGVSANGGLANGGLANSGSANSGSANSGLSLNMLAKLGNIGINAQGQITVNGQVVPGLTLSSLGVLGTTPTSLSPPVPGLGSVPGASVPGVRAAAPPPMQHCDNAVLASLLSSVSQQQQPTGAGLSAGLQHGGLQHTGLPTGLPTAQLSDFNLLFNAGLAPHQALAAAVGPLSGSMGLPTAPARSNSPISAAGLLGAHPQPNIGGLMSAGTKPGLGELLDSQAASRYRPRNNNKISPMQIRTKFGQLGPSKGQFNSPHGFCLGMDEDIVVADTNNHRIQVFEKSGEFKYQFGIPGREEGQLWYPRKVAVIRSSGKYVVCDRGSERSRMQLFTKSGQFIKKISIRYIDIVAGLAITAQGHIVAVDSVSPTVFCITEMGDLVKWFDCSEYMREPSDIAVSGKDYYVCDFKGHCVVVFNENGEFLHRIGCENVTNYPNGIDISDAGDVLVGDSHGNRFHVAVFQRDGSLIGEFECPYVKVSRCCGLKITSEGYVVTLAKNNQHVLLLNTLYIA